MSRVDGWNYIYRPMKLDECILPARLRQFFTKLQQTETMPNMVFTGPNGIGKLAVAAMVSDRENLFVTDAEPRRKVRVGGYETKDPWGYQKHVLAYVCEWQLVNKEFQDEIGYWMEFGYSVSFIIATADESKLIPRLRSRLLKVDFHPRPDEIGDLKQQARLRCRKIFTQANVEVTDEEIARIVDETFPDFRLMVNELFSLSLQKAA